MPLRCLTHPDFLAYGQAVYKIEFYVESASHSVLWNAKVARNGPLPLCVCIVDVVTTCILIAARSVSRQNALYLKILWDEYCTFVSITNIYHHSAAGIPPHVILIDFFFLGKSSGQSPRRQIHTGNQRLHLKAPVKAVDGRWLRTKCLDGSTQSNAIYLLHAWFCVKERKRERAHCARVEFTLRRQPYTISHGDDPGRILAQR